METKEEVDKSAAVALLEELEAELSAFSKSLQVPHPPSDFQLGYRQGVAIAVLATRDKIIKAKNL